MKVRKMGYELEIFRDFFSEDRAQHNKLIKLNLGNKLYKLRTIQ